MRKKIRILILCIYILILFSNVVQATSGLTDISLPKDTEDRLKTPLDVTIGLFQITATGMGAIMLTVLAIKYMTSAPGDKAEIKKHAVVYIVGACMAFGATGIVEIIKNFAQNELK